VRVSPLSHRWEQGKQGSTHPQIPPCDVNIWQRALAWGFRGPRECVRGTVWGSESWDIHVLIIFEPAVRGTAAVLSPSRRGADRFPLLCSKHSSMKVVRIAPGVICGAPALVWAVHSKLTEMCVALELLSTGESFYFFFDQKIVHPRVPPRLYSCRISNPSSNNSRCSVDPRFRQHFFDRHPMHTENLRTCTGIHIRLERSVGETLAMNPSIKLEIVLSSCQADRTCSVQPHCPSVF